MNALVESHMVGIPATLHGCAGCARLSMKGSVMAARITRKDVVEALAKQHNLPKSQADTLVLDLFAILAKHLKKGDTIAIAPFGTFAVTKRAARTGRNPATGEPIKIKASKSVKFKPFTALKSSLK